jgi:hypothetical protein
MGRRKRVRGGTIGDKRELLEQGVEENVHAVDHQQTGVA